MKYKITTIPVRENGKEKQLFKSTSLEFTVATGVGFLINDMIPNDDWRNTVWTNAIRILECPFNDIDGWFLTAEMYLSKGYVMYNPHTKGTRAFKLFDIRKREYTAAFPKKVLESSYEYRNKRN